MAGEQGLGHLGLPRGPQFNIQMPLIFGEMQSERILAEETWKRDQMSW